MRPLRVLRFGMRSIFRRMKIGSINLILTRRCNLNCKYCCTTDKENGIELSVEEWKKIIEKFARRHFIFAFSGGEPLLYKGTHELIDYASRRGLTGLLTNGLLITERHLQKFKRLDYLGLSFDEFHGYNVFLKSAWDKLKMIKDYSRRFGFTVEVTMVVTAKNASQIPLIISKMNRLKLISCPNLLHSERGNWWVRKSVPELEFKTEKDFSLLKELQEILIKMKKSGYRISVPLEYLMKMDKYLKNISKVNCLAAENYFAVNNDGFIMGCQDIPPSKVNALDFKDYEAMKKEVKKTIPKNCRCWWDCFYLYSFIDKYPFRFVFSKIIDGIRISWKDLAYEKNIFKFLRKK